MIKRRYARLYLQAKSEDEDVVVQWSMSTEEIRKGCPLSCSDGDYFTEEYPIYCMREAVTDKQRCANVMVVYAEDFLLFGVNEKGGAPLLNVSSFTHGFQGFKRLHCFSRASFSV